jgi:hypothetical protein
MDFNLDGFLPKVYGGMCFDATDPISQMILMGAPEGFCSWPVLRHVS